MDSQEIVTFSLVDGDFGWTFRIDIGDRAVVQHYVTADDGKKIQAYLKSIEGLIYAAMSKSH